MFYLTGTAATSALDLIATLQQTLGTNNAGGTQAPATGFDTATAAAGGTSGTTGAASDPTSGASAPQSLLAPDTLDALLAVQGQNQAPIVNGDAFSQQLFSLLDTNGDGSISKSEFETAFGQNGNTTQADQIFAKLDANGDGSISQSELTNALDGQDQSQGSQGVGGHHHHHHMGGMGGMGEMGGAGASGGATGDSSGGSSDPLAALGGTSQSVTNTDGSTTTTITYADGSSVSMTTPAAGSSNSGSTSNGNSGSNASNASQLNNYIEQMIQRQAQWFSSQSAGQSLAVSV